MSSHPYLSYHAGQALLGALPTVVDAFSIACDLRVLHGLDNADLRRMHSVLESQKPAKSQRAGWSLMWNIAGVQTAKLAVGLRYRQHTRTHAVSPLASFCVPVLSHVVMAVLAQPVMERLHRAKMAALQTKRSPRLRIFEPMDRGCRAVCTRNFIVTSSAELAAAALMAAAARFSGAGGRGLMFAFVVSVLCCHSVYSKFYRRENRGIIGAR